MEIAKEFRIEKFTYAELEEEDADLRKLQGWLEKIRKLDFYEAPLGRQAAERLRGCEAELARYAERVFEVQGEAARMTAPAIACRGVTRSFGKGEARVAALRGVDLDVNAGEIVLLSGPSGCGKTTLLSIIATLLDADDGEVAIAGEPTTMLPPPSRAALRARLIGFVFQSFNLLPALDARQNVSVPLLLAGSGRDAAERRAARRWRPSTSPTAPGIYRGSSAVVSSSGSRSPAPSSIGRRCCCATSLPARSTTIPASRS